MFCVYRIQSNPILTIITCLQRCDVMNVSHDHFGNLRRTSRVTTEKYGKINAKRKSNRKSTEFVNFLAVSGYRQLYLLDIFSYYVYM